MEIIFEVLFEFILEGSMGAVGDKKVPMPLRILAALILFIVFGGLIGGLLYLGISESSPVALIFGLVILVIVIFAILNTVKTHRK